MATKEKAGKSAASKEMRDPNATKQEKSGSAQTVNSGSKKSNK